MTRIETVLCYPVRTAIGIYGGSLKDIPAPEATQLMHSMQRDGLKRGIVTLCIGGGQGIALALKML